MLVCLYKRLMHPSGYSRAASGWLQVPASGGPPGTVADDRTPSEELEEHDRQYVVDASSAGDADSGEQCRRDSTPVTAASLRPSSPAGWPRAAPPGRPQAVGQVCARASGLAGEGARTQSRAVRADSPRDRFAGYGGTHRRASTLKIRP